ncbi:MAG TPA: EAL domain-containing protein, partial [Acidimicrobiales bacterium]|nr:EAL domain-containing protein [Acidimicrobiales bacterium]
VEIAQRLGLETLAEGIETAEQLERLRYEGCYSGQGFYLARPLEAGAMNELVAGAPAHPAARQYEAAG